MAWEPISPDGMRALLADALTRLDEATRALWARYGCTPYRVSCVRGAAGNASAPESIYVVARAESAVVVYDDVEEEFGAGALGEDGVLRRWSNYGELRWALPELSTEATRPEG